MSLVFLKEVLKAMKIPDKFIQWILLLHHEIDTSFLLTFITKPIEVIFSIRQGDCISMVLFILYMEPLLLRLQEVCSGVQFKARMTRSLASPLVTGLVETDESYVDDVGIFCSSDEDFLKVDRIVERFEKVSGAILNRSSKSVVLGLGKWKRRTNWPLKWLRTVNELKIFGFFIQANYREIVKRNWNHQLSKFSSTIFSWSNRALPSLQQRADVITMFALSKVWFRGQVLPLSNKFALKFESLISKFIWKGHITNNVLSRDTIYLPKERGGLGVPSIKLKCKALFMRQFFRSIFGKQHGKNHIDFWLGSRLGLPQLTSDYYHLKGKAGSERDCTPPLFCSALSLISEAFADGIFSVSDVKDLTTKQIYVSLLDTLPAPQVELKYLDQDWQLTWERLQSGALDTEARSYLYLIIHDRVGTKERGHRLMPRKFTSNLCNRCLIFVEDCNHRYMHCSFVSEIWGWVLATSQILEPSLAFSDEKSFLRLDFPKGFRENALLWLIGNYVELVEREVVSKDKKLDLQSVQGYLKQKKNTFLTFMLCLILVPSRVLIGTLRALGKYCVIINFI